MIEASVDVSFSGGTCRVRWARMVSPSRQIFESDRYPPEASTAAVTALTVADVSSTVILTSALRRGGLG